MKLYVGTYAKYNNGSIAGKWLNLNDYASKEEFLLACKAVHKDERDPEFMFQDYEAMEDWEQAFYSEFYIDAKYWDVLREEQKKAKKPKKRNADKEEQFAIMDTIGITDKEYCYKNGRYIRLADNVVVCVNHPSIETSFCFDDEREDCHEMCDKAKTLDYFMAENMRKFKTDEKLNTQCVYIFPHDYINRSENYKEYAIEKDTYALENHHVMPYERINRTEKYLKWQQECRELTGAEREHFIAEYKKAREAFRNRCERWYKRFGSSKIRTWTYWANR